ncbi:MAG: transcription antitermination factor NusB [Candidatus Subteraquimicrobiales bacterium]|nr:transcription antitermination factor NusB [Candidatus Subteraquimicrobiales bacterium]
MLERRKARIAALEVLYQRDITGSFLEELLKHRTSALTTETEPLSDFALRLIRGTIEHQEEIDNLISEKADNWALDRIAVVDRNILRLSIYSLLYEKDIPAGVTINEAIELAKIYGEADSSKFINGILGGIAREIEKETPKEELEDEKRQE